MKAAVVLLCTVLFAGVAAARPSPFYELDDVTYYMAHGREGSVNLTYGDGVPLNFDGCAFVMLRPDLRHGVVRVTGLADNVTPFEVQFGNITALGVDTAGGDAMEDAEGDLGDARPPAGVITEAVAWGTAGMRANGRTLTDPASSENQTEAFLWLTGDGVVDGGEEGAKDWEIHLSLDSLPGKAQPPITFAFRSSGLPDGTVPPADTHTASFPFLGMAFLGQATVTIETSTVAAPGMNDLRFQAYSPTGKELGNWTGAPAIGAPQSGTIAFPLEELGTYRVTVTGSIALAKYTVVVTQEAPSDLALDFSWDAVDFGSEAVDGFNDCRVFEIAGTAVGRQPPPPYQLGTVAIGVAATAVAVLVLINLVAYARTASALRRKTGSKE